MHLGAQFWSARNNFGQRVPNWSASQFPLNPMAESAKEEWERCLEYSRSPSTEGEGQECHRQAEQC
jgi:hypothetical protein